MASSVRKAVIPAAGMGTRFLPATKAMPKEMLTLVDKPAIQYVVEEAVHAGITDILIITGRGKRAIDLPCRYGGEEFTVVMPGADLEAAEKVAERIRLHVSGSPFRVAGGEKLLSVTISIGVAASQDDSDTPDALIKRADEALYAAKAAGRDRVAEDGNQLAVRVAV